MTKLTSLSKRIKKVEKLLVCLVSLTSVLNLDTVSSSVRIFYYVITIGINNLLMNIFY